MSIIALEAHARDLGLVLLRMRRMEALATGLGDDGFAVIENALVGDELAALTEAVDAYHRRAGGGTLHELGFLGADDRFLALVDHRSVLPLVVATLGWNIFMYHCHLDVHPPSTELPRWRWHQDGGRQNVELESPRPRLSLKVAWFLTDVTDAEMGALTVIPGSHRRDRLERPPDGSLLPPGARPLVVSAGTAVVFDRRLWHARGENTSQATRKALFYGYTYRWIRPRDELVLAPGLVERLDPVRRQLLGAGTSATGHWIPTEADVPLRAIEHAH
jgi:ectoine hydroxylase